jgi:hypothetical protein
MVGVGWDQRRGESPGATAERLASTPRQYRPIADPVQQRSSLGILYGRRRERGCGLTRITIESRDEMRKAKATLTGSD